MLLSFSLYFALLPLVLAESLSHTTITPDVDQILQGLWTVSVALPSSTTLEVDIETQFNEINAVTLVGPTTLVTIIRIRSAISNGSRGATGPSRGLSSHISNMASSVQIGGTASGPTATGNAASNVQSVAPQAASPSPTIASPPRSSSSASSSKSLTITQNQGPYGKDPDSVMADEIDKAYANVTYTPPAYVPAKIPADVCVLWDPGCKGNRTLVANMFFGTGNFTGGTMNALQKDSCFEDTDAIATGTNCTSSLLNPADASLSTAAKSYMRQAQCTKDYASALTTSRGDTHCCGPCWIYGPNVDVYYWPEPNSDTSCLDIIGSSVVPPDEGAQTDAGGVVYWAATTDLYDIYVPTVTTALITTINGVVVKEALANPWDASPSITTIRPVPVPSNKKRSPLPMHPRAFNALYARERTEVNNSVVTGVTAGTMASVTTGSIAVSDGFTFTSPSVYVAFYSLSATDVCGIRGKTISSTMLAFAPGELSTVQGHLWGGGNQVKSTKVFNFADLPCPPQSVMYDDWYKPAPGEPYRPLIALPDKVRNLDLWWTACTEAFYFTGLDPARTLAAATEMVKPAVTAVDPGSTPDPAQPVPALPSNTGAGMIQPTPAPGDPSGDKNLAPPPEPVPQNNDPSTAGGSPPTPTTKGVDPQQGADSKADVPVPVNSPADSPPAANSPAANPFANNAPAAYEPVNNEPNKNQPASNPLAANPPTNTAANLHFVTSKQNADPNAISPAQLSQLHQALQPVPSSVSNPDSEPGSGTSSSEPQTDSGGTSPPSHPATNDNQPSKPDGSSSGGQSQPVVPWSHPVPTVVSNGSPPSQNGDWSSGQPSQPVVAGANAQPKAGPPSETPDQSAGVSSSGATNPPPPGTAHIVIGSSTIQLPQVTAQPAPAVAGKPVVNIGGGKLQVESQILSPGGATANVAGIPVYVNAQGAPVVGTQTYQPSEAAATTTIGSHVVVVNTAGVAVNGQQIQPNAAPVNIGGTPVQIQGPTVDRNPSSGGNSSPGSNPGSGNNPASGTNPASGNSPTTGNNPPIDNNVLQLPQGSSPPVTTVAGPSVVNNQGTYHLQGKPLAPGSAIAISGTTWSLGSEGASSGPSLNEGGQAYNLPEITPSPIDTLAGQAVQVVGPSAVAINGQTIKQGAPPITISSIPIVFEASNVIIGSNTILLASQTQALPSPVLNVPGNPALTQIANSPNVYMVAGSTIAPGSSAAVVNGTTYSLAPSGSLVVGTSTIPLATAGVSTGGNGALSAGNQVFTPMEGGTAVAIGGSILSVNGPVTTNQGTVVSLASGGLVVDSSTYAFATPAPNAAATTQEVPITTALDVAGQTFTANPSAFPIDGTTISAGGPGVTVSETPVSLDSGGNLVVGTNTVPLESTSVGAVTMFASTFEGSAMQAKAPCLRGLAGILLVVTYQLL